jgi:hypothetical protein
MKTEIEKTMPYSELSFATEPTRRTKFWRRSFIFQLIRFFPESEDNAYRCWWTLLKESRDSVKIKSQFFSLTV